MWMSMVLLMKRSATSPNGDMCQWADGLCRRRYCLSRFDTICPPMVMMSWGTGNGCSDARTCSKFDARYGVSSGMVCRLLNVSAMMMHPLFAMLRMLGARVRASSGESCPTMSIVVVALCHDSFMSGVRENAVFDGTYCMSRSSGRVGAEKSNIGSLIGTLICTGPADL